MSQIEIKDFLVVRHDSCGVPSRRGCFVSETRDDFRRVPPFSVLWKEEVRARDVDHAISVANQVRKESRRNMELSL
jgi:hypothetical protein